MFSGCCGSHHFSILIPSRHLRLLGLVLVVLGLAPAAMAGQKEEGHETPQVAIPADTTVGGTSVIFPVLGYTPDTSLLAGATYLRFFQLGDGSDGSRPSTVTPVAIFTTKKQLMLILGTDLYWDEGRHHASATLQYMRFPEQFYGIGRDTRAGDEEDYTPEEIDVNLLVERKFYRQWSFGPAFRFGTHRLIEIENDGQLASGTVPGTESTTLVAPALQLTRDTRDNTWSPRTGSYVLARTGWYSESLGSDYEFTEYIADLRRYLPLGGKGTLAFQAAARVQEGDPPFYVLPRLGGFEGLRGYISSRYPDRARLLVRGEWRSGEFWKGLGCTVFAGMGDVAPSPDKLTTSARLYTAGFGFRYTINREQQVKIRMDMGFGNGDSGFYLGLGEAF